MSAKAALDVGVVECPTCGEQTHDLLGQCGHCGAPDLTPGEPPFPLTALYAPSPGEAQQLRKQVGLDANGNRVSEGLAGFWAGVARRWSTSGSIS
jgi:hypothetical protein